MKALILLIFAFSASAQTLSVSDKIRCSDIDDKSSVLVSSRGERHRIMWRVDGSYQWKWVNDFTQAVSLADHIRKTGRYCVIRVKGEDEPVVHMTTQESSVIENGPSSIESNSKELKEVLQSPFNS